MNSTEKEQRNFDWNSWNSWNASNNTNNTNNTNSYNNIYKETQETRQDIIPNSSFGKQLPINDLLKKSNTLSNYLSQTSISEELKEIEKESSHLCTSFNDDKPSSTTNFNLSTLFDCVLAPRIVDFNKLLTKIDHVFQYIKTFHNIQNDSIMEIKEELKTFREIILNQINSHEETLEKRVEEIFTRSLKANKEEYRNFIKEEISKQSTFILSQINESFKTLVSQIPQDKYVQINSLNQLFSRDVPDHHLFDQISKSQLNNANVHNAHNAHNAHNVHNVHNLHENVISQDYNRSAYQSDLTSNTIIIRENEMDYTDSIIAYDFVENSVSHNMPLKNIQDYDRSYQSNNTISLIQEKEMDYTHTNSIIESEFIENSAFHVPQLNKMSLENIIL